MDETGQNRTPEPPLDGDHERARKAVTWTAAFLAQLRLRGNVLRSCEAAKISRSTAYERYDSDPDFAKAWDEAVKESSDRLEDEAWRRAYEGLVRKKFTPRGDPVMDPETGEQYFEREYSDQLLIQLLKANRPEKFRERYDITHKGGQSLEIVESIVDADEPPTEAARNPPEPPATALPPE